MDEQNININQNDMDVEQKHVDIKEHLKNYVSEYVYDTWIDNFVFEKITPEEIVVGYYGSEPLKKFNSQYKETVWIHICSVAGYSKKFKIYKRSGKTQKAQVLSTPKVSKNIKTAKLFIISAIFAFLALCFAIVTVNYIVNRNFRETFYTVSSLKVENNVRVIQISDMHNARFGKDNKKLIERIQKLDPDIILCTGDIIDSATKDTSRVVSMCSQLSKIAPSYYIYGNNEVERVYDFPLSEQELDKKFGFNKNNRDGNKLIEYKDDFEREIEKTGVKVLKNQTDTITVGNIEVDVFGVLTSNPSSFFSYSGGEFDSYINSNPHNLKITAIHEPFIFEEFDIDYWGDLIACGHTHGGTVRVPLLGPLFTHEGGLFPERNGDFVYGRYDVSGSPIIVSSGLETSNPLRINNQPELVIIDINKF